MHLTPRQFLYLAKCSYQAWSDDYASSMGAAIAFYTVFSIAPLLIIVIAVAGFIWGEDAVRGEVIQQLGGLVGQEGAESVQALIRSADRPAQGITATLVSVVILLVGATRVFAELQSALDRIWKVPALQSTAGWWRMLRARLLSLGLVLGMGFLLLVSLVISAGLAVLGGWTAGLLPGWEVLLQGLNALASLAISTVLFAVIFKYMPQASIAWRDVWIGAIVTAVLFEIGKVLIGLYVGKSSTVSSLTAAGSLVIVLIWVYYAAQVFLLGAEFTWFYANHHGSRRKGAGQTSLSNSNKSASSL
ncbi:YihY/virulence factor BrkB family protein [Paenalcaligenes niemegkensis]|uniref:YihY/virulence factor BrkB family protein n=1 Tax=Paenalcaligenes niemegkensis TaxID=2895469 RepID=UPI001EE98416|nr:YihY/virulence factor BrkB family protein [Paenalcaligenes niemegkensis]MCQ9617039.1 YihY/virulence factor BrkB family protein [Paenalcaligenes niemegkensis]